MSELLLVLAPLRIEAFALGRHRNVSLLRSGMGPERAAAAASRARALEAGAVAIAGLCAGIDPALRAGDVVCASELHGEGVDPVSVDGCEALAAALSHHGLRVHVGPLACSARIEGPARRRARRGEALALDMESAWLAAAAAGRPLAVARVVVDADGRRLADPRIAIAAIAALRSLRLVGDALPEWARSLRPRAPSAPPLVAAREPPGVRAGGAESLRFQLRAMVTPQ